VNPGLQALEGFVVALLDSVKMGRDRRVLRMHESSGVMRGGGGCGGGLQELSTIVMLSPRTGLGRARDYTFWLAAKVFLSGNRESDGPSGLR